MVLTGIVQYGVGLSGTVGYVKENCTVNNHSK